MNRPTILEKNIKINRKTIKLTIALDIGKNTGYAICFHPSPGNTSTNRFVHGSGNPFDVSEIIKTKSRISKDIHFLFYYEEIWKNQKTTSTLKRYKKIIVDSFLFSYPEIKISLFNRNEVTNQFLGFRPEPKERNEKVIKEVLKAKFKKIDDYDEADALMLLVWYIRKKNAITKVVL